MHHWQYGSEVGVEINYHSVSQKPTALECIHTEAITKPRIFIFRSPQHLGHYFGVCILGLKPSRLVSLGLGLALDLLRLALGLAG